MPLTCGGVTIIAADAVSITSDAVVVQAGDCLWTHRFSIDGGWEESKGLFIAIAQESRTIPRGLFPTCRVSSADGGGGEFVTIDLGARCISFQVGSNASVLWPMRGGDPAFGCAFPQQDWAALRKHNGGRRRLQAGNIQRRTRRVETSARESRPILDSTAVRQAIGLGCWSFCSTRSSCGCIPCC